MIKKLTASLFVVLAIAVQGAVSAAGADRPNIVMILCDDLGYGDVQCLNPEHGKIPTPGMDRIAREGAIFTDAHSGSSVCTPTRYGLLTGRYAWRTTLQSGVGQGFQPCLIAEERPTLAGFLKSNGYHTGIVGKWHLNCEFLDGETKARLDGKEHKWTAPVGATVPDGPVHRGFDFFHGIHHARSMKSIIENDRVTEHDAVINFLPRCAKQCVGFIESQKDADKPFFFFVPLGSPHTPIVPTDEWKGRSGLGDYGDFVMQTDDAVVQILRTLDEIGAAENTIVILMSDNGCSRAAGIGKLAAKGHKVSAHLRGSKADIWDGGHRIPFLVRWPGHVEAGSQTDQLVCLTDWFATIAAVLEVDVPAKSCEDSMSFLHALQPGVSNPSQRSSVIHHSVSGHFAIRDGSWKLALARGSGGWSAPNEKKASADAPEAQLYDMKADVGEQQNLYRERPEVATRLLGKLVSDVNRGRTTEGAESENDVANDEINLWKSGRK